MVIPAIDEAGALAPLLADLNAQQGVVLQTIVADGGSRDASVAIARAHGVQVVESEPGRGVQTNTGAARASGQWLCFLHADSRLTHPRQLADAVACLETCRSGRVAGHFPLRFVGDAGRARRFFYRYLEAKSATNRRHTINGDQGLILSAAFFAELGGFDTRLPFLEDQRIAAAIEQAGEWRLCPHPLATSARRFEREGRRARYLLMALIMAMHLAGIDTFFARAPGVYARQADTGRLALLPYFRLLRTLWRDCGTRRALAVSWRIAGVALSQSWQPFFALDVLMGRPVAAGPATRLHDRYLRPAIQNRVFQALLLVCLLACVFGPLQLWCRLREKPSKAVS